MFGQSPSERMGILDSDVADDIDEYAYDLLAEEDWELEKVRLDAMSMGAFSKSLGAEE